MTEIAQQFMADELWERARKVTGQIRPLNLTIQQLSQVTDIHVQTLCQGPNPRFPGWCPQAGPN